MSSNPVGFVLVLASVCFAVVAGKWSERGETIWRSKYPEEFDGDGYLEGDMEVVGQAKRKNGLRDESARWTQAIIPYEVVGPYTIDECVTIESAFELYHQKTCIRFRVRQSNDTDYVRIINEPGCHAEVGRVGGDQILNIGDGPCINKGTVMHELMHVVGFMHEQKRFDRDDYIKVIYKNLRDGKQDNFKKQDRDTISSFGVAYDYESITHYSPLAFSKNGQPTVMLRKHEAVNLGQREYLSPGDIEKINRMYNCTQQQIMSRPVFAKLC